MPLVTTTEMLRDAKVGGYAVGAFNIENMEMAQAVIAAAEAAGAPVILQTTPSTLRYATLDTFAGLVTALAKNATVPVALHLDHGNSFDLAVQAVRAGYTSVMLDGSGLPLEENIDTTRRVVDVCAPNGIPVEGELGKVGGKEDDLVVNSATFTDPATAAEFVERTGVTSLAVAIGTVHGEYHGEPQIDVPLLRRIRETVTVPLVLHGSPGLPAATIRECIAAGISKVNFATELRAAYTAAVSDYFATTNKPLDPKAYGALAREAVQAAVADRIALCSAGAQLKAAM